ncbi:MAG: ceramidase domain-containing protein [Deltaproteobacteria bacterium]|nr:ceramidase domain-containing protein [Deltaproteobacteria bacterium]
MGIKGFILVAVSTAVVGFTFRFVKPIRQDEGYHNFADARTIMGVPNFMNVVSNIFFVFAGLFGLYAAFNVWETRDRLTILSYLTFFGGVLLTGFGSAWYHLKPDNERLVWDRLPMTISFAGLFSSVLSETSYPSVGAILLFPLIILGIFSVIYWIRGERRGKGDLRLYGLIQFLPALLIPLILFTYGGSKEYILHLSALVLFYALAKLFEFLDEIIYSNGKVVSGHTLKHISASAGVACMAWIFI